MVFHYIQTEGTKVITQSNLYNGNGQRVQKQEGDNTINYLYQGNNVLYTTNGDGNKTSHNFIGLEGNTISTIRYNLAGLEYYIYNKDIKGSISNIVDNNGNAKISYTYSDFGETEEVGDTIFYNEIAYTGGIYDENTSLYYLNARYYNPEDAIFITQDTYRGSVENPNSLHLYAYCTNNPINYVDPSGHMPSKLINAILGGISALVLDYTISFLCYYMINNKTMKFSTFGVKNTALSLGSGVLGGILMTTKYNRIIQAIGSGAIAGVKSYLSNRKGAKSIKTILNKIIADMALGTIVGYICGNGLGYKKYSLNGVSYIARSSKSKYGPAFSVTVKSKTLKWNKSMISDIIKVNKWSFGSSLISNAKTILNYIKSKIKCIRQKINGFKKINLLVKIKENKTRRFSI